MLDLVVIDLGIYLVMFWLILGFFGDLLVDSGCFGMISDRVCTCFDVGCF